MACVTARSQRSSSWFAISDLVFSVSLQSVYSISERIAYLSPKGRGELIFAGIRLGTTLLRLKGKEESEEGPIFTALIGIPRKQEFSVSSAKECSSFLNERNISLASGKVCTIKHHRVA